jgi:hypothetical protein
VDETKKETRMMDKAQREGTIPRRERKPITLEDADGWTQRLSRRCPGHQRLPLAGGQDAAFDSRHTTCATESKLSDSRHRASAESSRGSGCQDVAAKT